MIPSRLLEHIGLPEVERWRGHPFVSGLSDGTLPIEAFRWYLQQDWLYLKNYVRVYARLAGVAPDGAMEHLVHLAHELVTTELGLIKAMMEPFDVELVGIEPTPVNREYQEFLLDAAARDFAEGVAATMPCLWGYSVLGRGMPEPPADGSHPYRSWVDVYRADSMRANTDLLLGLLDEAVLSAADTSGNAGTAPDLTAIERAFRRAFELEMRFWDNPHLISVPQDASAPAAPGARDEPVSASSWPRNEI
jgi:thiaminase (transcriptional activator TenA)